MTFDINARVVHDDPHMKYDPQSWIMGPDDDFVPAEYNSTMYMFQRYRDPCHGPMLWTICDTWAMTPGDHDVDITPAP